jgi:ferredoxin-fold anticodon binding domain-containing protein
MKYGFEENWDFNGDVNYPQYPSNKVDWCQTLITKINFLGNKIHQKTRRGRPNRIELNSSVFRIINNLEYYNPLTNKINDVDVVINDEINDDIIYVINDDNFLKKLRGEGIIECYETIERGEKDINGVSSITFRLLKIGSNEYEEWVKDSLENEKIVLLYDECYVGKINILNYDKGFFIDAATGEINLPKETLPYETDYFFPSPNYDETVDINTLPGVNNLFGVDDLRYFFEKFIKTVETKKPNVRLANQLKLLIDCSTIKLLTEDSRTTKHNILDNNFKMTFKIPVGDINKDEQENWLKKLKKMIKF